MSKVKYYYDQDTLSYRPIKVTNKNRISNVILFILASLFFGITSYSFPRILALGILRL